MTTTTTSPSRAAENTAALVLIASVITVSLAGAFGAWRVLAGATAVGAAASAYLHWPRRSS